jgi:hypothetical protein
MYVCVRVYAYMIYICRTLCFMCLYVRGSVFIYIYMCVCVCTQY